MHAHLLPGIDDGPESVEGALEMARAAMATGIATIAATPHLRADFPDVHVEELADRCQKLSRALEHNRIPVRIVGGAEVSLIWALEAGHEHLRLASYGQRGNDLLIETPVDVSGINQLLYPLRSRGYRITLAHPERSGAFQRHPEMLQSLTEQGVLLQVNADALLVQSKSSKRKLTEYLLREGLAHSIASDAHRAAAWRRVTALAEGVEAANSLIGRPRSTWMSCDAPAAIIAGSALPAAPEIELAPRRWWRRLGG